MPPLSLLRSRARAAAAALALAAILASCAQPGSSGDISVTASLPCLDYLSAASAKGMGLSSKTILPASLDLSSISYRATFTPLTAVGDAVRSAESTTGSFAFQNLRTGDWTILVQAYAKDGTTLIGSGSQTAGVTAGGATAATIDLSPPSGSGSLALSLSWPSSPYSPTVTLTPILPSGALATLTATASTATSASYEEGALASGVYLLYAAFNSGSGTKALWSASEIVYVLPGRPSQASIVIASLNSPPEAFASVSAARKYNTTSMRYDEATLSWFGALGATSYLVERKSSSGSAGLDGASYATLTTISSGASLGLVDTGLDQALYYRYRVTASNAYGKNAPVEASVAVVTAGTVGSTASPVADRTVTIMGSATLTAGGSYAASVGGAALVAPSYVWTFDGTAIVGETGATIDSSSIIAKSGISEGSYAVLGFQATDGGWSWSGSKEVSYPKPTGTNKWSYATGGVIGSSPAIVPDGTVYVASNDAYLYALNPDGSLKRTYSLGGSAVNDKQSPAVASDGTIYMVPSDGTLFAFNGDGSTKWSLALGSGNANAMPAIASDGTIYIGLQDNKLYAVKDNSSSGSIAWSCDFGNAATYDAYSASIGADGTIYVGSSDKRLYAVRPDGTIKWSYTAGGSITAAPSIDGDGYIYFGAQDGKVYALKPDGSAKWGSPFNAGAAINSTPAIGSSGRIYVGSYGGTLFAITASDGSQAWSYSGGADVTVTPALASDGTVYCVSSSGNKLLAIGPSGSLLWDYGTGGTIYSSPAIAADGTVYFGCGDQKLHAVYGSSGPASCPWQGYGKNSRHTGNAAD
jgi:FOG: WD40-like repeat